MDKQDHDVDNRVIDSDSIYVFFRVLLEHLAGGHPCVCPHPRPLGIFLDKESHLGDVLLTKILPAFHELDCSKIGVEQVTFKYQDLIKMFNVVSLEYHHSE